MFEFVQSPLLIEVIKIATSQYNLVKFVVLFISLLGTAISTEAATLVGNSRRDFSPVPNNPTIHRWESSFRGKVNIEVKLPEIASDDEESKFNQKVFVDNKLLLSEDRGYKNGKSNYNFNKVDVRIGSFIKLLLDSPQENLAQPDDLVIDIKLPSGFIFIESPNPSKESNFAHVGLLVDGKVYSVNKAQGVNSQSLEEYIAYYEALYSSTIRYTHKEIPDLLAREMALMIATRLEDEYLDEIIILTTPEIAKGKNNSFTETGLIEWAAEEIDWFNGSQGFVQYHLEFTNTNCGKNDCIQPLISSLTPDFLDFAVKFYSQSLLQGRLDSVDFILTDPLGRRMGYIDEF